MDLQTLHNIFTGTYNPDPSIRHQAESSLNVVSHQPGFIPACLDLVLNPLVEALVKLSASINVKNFISQNWRNSIDDVKNSNSANAVVISKEEKFVIKSKLMQIIIDITEISITAEQQNFKYEDIHDLVNLKKNQLFPTLSNIITLDHRSNDDDEFFNSVADLIVNNGNNFAKLYAGLFCLMETLRTYRWSYNKVRSHSLDPIIVKLFPILLEIADPLATKQQYVGSTNDKLKAVIDDLHGELLKFIMKCFKFVIYHDLPVPLQDKQTSFNWVNLHLQIINMSLPDYVLSLVSKADEDAEVEFQIKSNQWVKAKKWSFSNLSLLFNSYGTPMTSLMSSSNSYKEKNYLEFKIFFLDDFVPEILTLYFKLVSNWCSQDLYLSTDCLYYLITFLDNCIKINKLWKNFFKDNLEEIVSKFLISTLIVRNSTLKLIEEDPMEYIHINMDIFDDNPGIHDLAALNMIATMAEVRQSFSLPRILKICHDMLVELHSNEYETLENAKKKEAVLRIMGIISHILVNPNNDYYSHISDFLQYFVIPNMINKHAFLRLRALEIISKYSTVELNQTSLYKIYQYILINLNIINDENRNIQEFIPNDDTLLPVQTQASLTLQAFLNYPALKDLLLKDIVIIMEKMLSLSKQVDLDVISGVMQDIVESFSEQLQPFGIELMKNLSEQIISILDEEEDLKAINPDKQMIINGILNTMITILLSFETSNESIFELENSFLVVVKVVLDNHMDDFYSEIFELIESSTFLSRKISSNMWNVFLESILEKNFKAHKHESLILTYLAEITPVLNNYLNYGHEDIVNNETFAVAFFELLKIIVNNGYYPDELDQFNIENLYIFSELATNFVLSLKIKTSQYLNDLVIMACEALIKKTITTLLKDSSDPQPLLQVFNSTPLQYHSTLPIFGTIFNKMLENRRLKVNFLNLLISGLIYDIHTTLNLLIKYNLFEFFFQTWFGSLMSKKTSSAELKRVFDLKISTLGLLSLMNNLSPEEFNKYQLNLVFDKIIQNLILLIEKLPIAINALEKKRSAFDDTSFDYNAEDQKLFEGQFHAFANDDDDDDWLNEERQLLNDSPDTTVKSSGDIKNGEFLTFLKTESIKLESELRSNNINSNSIGEKNDDDAYFDEDYDDDDDAFDDDDVVEDPLSNNPLDNLNIFTAVKLSLNHLEQADTGKYQAFVSHLNPTQLSMLQTILNLN